MPRSARSSADAISARLRDLELTREGGLQLLHAFVRDRANAGRSTTITLASPILADAARSLALAASLGVDTPTGEPA